MDTLHLLAQGILTAASPLNLLYGFAGVLLGTLVGVLPGLGPAGAIALLLPLALHAPPLAYLIMLFGITYGAQYGGSTTSILVNIPGEASSVITCLDGYAMARQGRAGPALGIAAFGSFIGGTVSIFGLAYLAPVLAEFGLHFGPPEYAGLMLFGLTALVYLAHGPMDKALLMALFGSLLASVGLDPVTGQPRFTFDILVLRDGVGLTPVVIGLFGVSEVLVNLRARAGEVFQKTITEPATDLAGLERLRNADRARNPSGLFSRCDSRVKRCNRHVCRLCGRKKDFEASGKLWPRRHRRCRRAGDRQQRGEL